MQQDGFKIIFYVTVNLKVMEFEVLERVGALILSVINGYFKWHACSKPNKTNHGLVQTLIAVYRSLKMVQRVVALIYKLILTSVWLCGGWVPETSWTFCYWQPAPRWRLYRWWAKPDNPAMHPMPLRRQTPVTLISGGK